ncbi:MAG: glycosyltransferase [Solirubrobacteraceae bacterium]
MMRDLYVCSFAPTLGNGRALRTYTCVRALAMLGPVDLAYVPHGGSGPSPEYLAIDGLTFHEIKPSRGARRALVYGSKRLKAFPPACCRGTSPELIEVSERLARQPGRGRVIADDVNVATALMQLARQRPVIYNAHNLESEYPLGRDMRRAWSRLGMLRYERKLLGLVAESWMVSRADIASARAIAPSAQLRYIPNVVDVWAVEPRREQRPGSTLLMVGDFTYAPNRSARDYLVERILPLVRRSVADARVLLVGRGLDEWSPPDSGVEVTGFVPDLRTVYDRADCVVVPLTEGAGTPLKFIEALAYGMPVVATPFAAKGLELVPDVHFREAVDAESFAGAVVDVLRDGAPEMAAEGRSIAEREYSIETLAERIAA